MQSNKITITKTRLPEHSVLNNSLTVYNYADSYQGVFYDQANTITPVDAGKAFFKSGPKWIETLFELRNKLVSIFGLKTSGNSKDRKDQLTNFTCSVGEQMGLFKVINKTDNEIILGEDDKHLNFRVSLLITALTNEPGKKRLNISTTVIFNNWLGKLYFIPVKPFHQLIVPAMLKGIIEQLEKQAE